MTESVDAQLRIDTADGVSIVIGELDHATAPVFDDAVGAMVGPWMVVDLAGLTFVDSMGLRALLRAKQALARAPRRAPLADGGADREHDRCGRGPVRRRGRSERGELRSAGRRAR